MKIIILFLLTTCISSARIGETYEECVKRYGKPIEKVEYVNGYLKGDPKKQEFKYVFKKNKYKINISFLHNKAWELSYYPDSLKIIEMNEFYSILDINGEGWKQYDQVPGAESDLRFYKNADNTLRASFQRHFNLNISSIHIWNEKIAQEYRNIIETQNRAKAKKSIEGL